MMKDLNKINKLKSKHDTPEMLSRKEKALAPLDMKKVKSAGSNLGSSYNDSNNPKSSVHDVNALLNKNEN